MWLNLLASADAHIRFNLIWNILNCSRHTTLLLYKSDSNMLLQKQKVFHWEIFITDIVLQCWKCLYKVYKVAHILPICSCTCCLPTSDDLNICCHADSKGSNVKTNIKISKNNNIITIGNLVWQNNKTKLRLKIAKKKNEWH